MAVSCKSGRSWSTTCRCHRSKRLHTNRDKGSITPSSHTDTGLPCSAAHWNKRSPHPPGPAAGPQAPSPAEELVQRPMGGGAARFGWGAVGCCCCCCCCCCCRHSSTVIAHRDTEIDQGGLRCNLRLVMGVTAMGRSGISHCHNAQWMLCKQVRAMFPSSSISEPHLSLVCKYSLNRGSYSTSWSPSFKTSARPRLITFFCRMIVQGQGEQAPLSRQ